MTLHLWFDRQGRPITVAEADRLLTQPGYKRVARDEIDGILVSTVWLGLDHSFGHEGPLIFETMIFENGPLNETCWRYATEEQAVAGHQAAIRHVRQAIACRFGTIAGGRP